VERAGGARTLETPLRPGSVRPRRGRGPSRPGRRAAGGLASTSPANLPALSTLENVAILITDYEMPGKNGFVLSDDFHTHHPDVPVILVTAYRTESLDAQVLDRPFLRLVQKPVDYAVLHAMIHEACAFPGA
jgi:DNA-binding NtrC family response regulator